MKNNLIESLKGKLIVSCQASEIEPLYSPEALLSMAKASIEGGAFALRASTPLPIRYMKSFFDIPIIGLYKAVYNDSDVYITPTIKEVDAISISGAEIIAVDATLRKRPNNEKLEDILERIQKKHKLFAMADISTYEEAINADKLGFDLIGTTLSGYTPYSTQGEEPDFELLEKLVNTIKTPVIMEGKIWNPEQLDKAFKIGAYAVVIGSAITRPHLITKRFSEMISG
ncbi:MAG: N-acetylmannosamine-6-phosphate 2-epimerase [Candidatus Sericytochromatia bacterium]